MEMELTWLIWWGDLIQQAQMQFAFHMAMG